MTSLILTIHSYCLQKQMKIKLQVEVPYRSANIVVVLAIANPPNGKGLPTSSEISSNLSK